MKKLLVAGIAVAAICGGPAIAADIPPTKAPAYVGKGPVAAGFSWTGFYVGATAGGFWAEDRLSNPSGGFTADKSSFSGFLGGPTMGVNWQTGSLVFGLEGDYSWTDVKDPVAFGCANPDCIERLPYFATARARIGYAANNYLLYVTGGAAFTRIEVSQTGSFRSSGNATGWTIGAGLEGALNGNWSWKVEYLFADFGRPNIGATGLAFIPTVRHDLTEQVVRVGINYRFGSFGKGPVTAAY